MDLKGELIEIYNGSKSLSVWMVKDRVIKTFPSTYIAMKELKSNGWEYRWTSLDGETHYFDPVTN